MQDIVKQFYQRHMPEMLSATTAEQQRQIADHYIAHHPRYADIHNKATAFFAQHVPDMPREAVLSHLFGLGDNRFYPTDHLLLDTPSTGMTTLRALIDSLVETRLSLACHASPDRDAHHRHAHDHFAVQATGYAGPTFQAWTIQSAVMAYAHSCATMMHDIGDDLMRETPPPASLIRNATGSEREAVARFEREWQARFDRAVTPLATHWGRYLAKQTRQSGTVARHETCPDTGIPHVTFVLLDPDDAQRVRTAHFITDIAAGTLLDYSEHWQSLATQHYSSLFQAVADCHADLCQALENDPLVLGHANRPGVDAHLSDSLREALHTQSLTPLADTTPPA